MKSSRFSLEITSESLFDFIIVRIQIAGLVCKFVRYPAVFSQFMQAGYLARESLLSALLSSVKFTSKPERQNYR